MICPHCSNKFFTNIKNSKIWHYRSINITKHQFIIKVNDTNYSVVYKDGYIQSIEKLPEGLFSNLPEEIVETIVKTVEYFINTMSWMQGWSEHFDKTIWKQKMKRSRDLEGYVFRVDFKDRFYISIIEDKVNEVDEYEYLKSIDICNRCEEFRFCSRKGKIK